MNNRERKRDIKFEEYNDNGHTSKRLKTETNNQENDISITSSEIKELIKNSNMKELKNIFKISKFYDNEFIKCLLLLYKNKAPAKNLNYEISKDKYKIKINWNKWYSFSLSDTFTIENKNKNLLKFLLKHGVDINKVVYKNDKIPLFDACESGNIVSVEYLVEQGADVNKINEINETPLFYACKSGNKELVEYLVEQEADVNKENVRGETLLFNACESGNQNLVEYLVVEHRADIDKENRWSGEAPIFYACKSGNKELVEYLVKRGAI